jgi:hypothetical protein
VPRIKQSGVRIQNPIDNFIVAKLGEQRLKQSAPADPHTLIRRLSLDLTGLPPTPEEVATFVRDYQSSTRNRQPAIERAVDRLLASPAYGERMARMWLDIARYADSAGYGSDPLRTNVWPYRDWVINAFNRNLPYDQFTLEQLAGDLLPNATEDQIVATAFHRNTMTNTEGGTDDEEFRVAAVKDRVGVTFQAWMGLTMNCAQCHTHKFDPITQREYYQLFAIFNQTADSDKPTEEPTLPLPTRDQAERTQRLNAEIAALQQQLTNASATATVKPDELKQQLQQKQKELTAIRPVAVPVLKQLPKDKQRETRLMNKGNFLDPGDRVEPGFLKAFHTPPADAPLDRVGIARYLTSRDNPLTARVAVNRFWAQIFGTGLVETEEDFGTQGQFPSHPELLDWLAVEFMDENWDVKRFLKMLVLSATYQQATLASAEAATRDPRNRLLSHYPRRRLDAEAVRDQALALSGLLSRKLGGPSVYPPQPDGLWRAAFNGQRTYKTSTGEDRYRRGIYTFWRRTVPYPSMATFDAPSRENCTVRRLPTNTPLQAFVTLNDPAFVEAAQALGRRLARDGGKTIDNRVRFGLELALARPASKAQVKTLVALYEKELAHYRTNADAAKKLATDPLGPLPAGLDAAEAAAWTVIGNVILNLDGVLTKG